MRDPSELISDEARSPAKGEWNGEYYVSFGGGRDWEEARKYGFVSGGGGPFYSRTLSLLQPGGRLWVNVPSTGYVGVGIVEAGVLPMKDFMVQDDSGKTVPIGSIPGLKLSGALQEESDERGEYLVRVKWIKTVPITQAVKERGLFGNQNTVARPRTAAWQRTVERLKARFGIQS
jgi:hypothetical protein